MKRAVLVLGLVLGVLLTATSLAGAYPGDGIEPMAVRAMQVKGDYLLIGSR